jgi:hypothetical protein
MRSTVCNRRNHKNSTRWTLWQSNTLLRVSSLYYHEMRLELRKAFNSLLNFREAANSAEGPTTGGKEIQKSLDHERV